MRPSRPAQFAVDNNNRYPVMTNANSPFRIEIDSGEVGMMSCDGRNKTAGPNDRHEKA